MNPNRDTAGAGTSPTPAASREPTSLGKRPRTPSIGQRLTLALGLIAMAVFTVVGGVVYWALAWELERSDRSTLGGKVAVVRHFIVETQATGDFTGLKHHIDDVLIGHGELRVWLLDHDGRLVFGDGALPSETGRMDDVFALLRSDGVPMEGVTAVVTDAGALPVASMMVAVDVRPRLRLLAAFRWVLWLACTLGVLASIVLANWAARLGLNAVHRLSAQASSISSTALSMRLKSEGVDAELQDMVSAFNAALDRLESAYRQIEAFNADVAHELRTPLASLISAAQVTLATARSADTLRLTLEQQLEELEDMKLLVNDMLFLARSDQGEQATDIAEISLATEARKALNYYDAALAEAGLSAALHGEAVLRADGGLIRRALSNLLSNAIKHAPRGETIQVRLAMDDAHAVAEVFNPGPTIPEPVRQRMFDRFFRADDARSRTGESVGLGLAIVKAVAMMHGGTVYVRSEAGGNAIGMRIPG